MCKSDIIDMKKFVIGFLVYAVFYQFIIDWYQIMTVDIDVLQEMLDLEVTWYIQSLYLVTWVVFAVAAFVATLKTKAILEVNFAR